MATLFRLGTFRWIFCRIPAGLISKPCSDSLSKSDSYLYQCRTNHSFSRSSGNLSVVSCTTSRISSATLFINAVRALFLPLSVLRTNSSEALMRICLKEGRTQAFPMLIVRERTESELRYMSIEKRGYIFSQVLRCGKTSSALFPHSGYNLEYHGTIPITDIMHLYIYHIVNHI